MPHISLVTLGVEDVACAAKKAEWRGYSGCFRDPDGHLWEVAHNPFFELKADGHLVLPDAAAESTGGSGK